MSSTWIIAGVGSAAVAALTIALGVFASSAASKKTAATSPTRNWGAAPLGGGIAFSEKNVAKESRAKRPSDTSVPRAKLEDVKKAFKGAFERLYEIEFREDTSDWIAVPVKDDSLRLYRAFAQSVQATRKGKFLSEKDEVYAAKKLYDTMTKVLKTRGAPPWQLGRTKQERELGALSAEVGEAIIAYHRDGASYFVPSENWSGKSKDVVRVWYNRKLYCAVVPPDSVDLLHRKHTVLKKLR